MNHNKPNRVELKIKDLQLLRSPTINVIIGSGLLRGSRQDIAGLVSSIFMGSGCAHTYDECVEQSNSIFFSSDL